MGVLRDKQALFASRIAILRLVAFGMGYEITMGHAYRCPDCKVGHKHSLHKSRLAEDWNLFLDGKPVLDGNCHNFLHDIWDKMGGARRIKGDLGHYSMSHYGMR